MSVSLSLWRSRTHTHMLSFAGVGKFWALALGHDAKAEGEASAVLGFAQYLKLHVRLTKLLSPSFSASYEPSLSELAHRDWLADLERVGAADTSRETGRMGWAAFVESLFELCDLWVATPLSDEAAPAAYKTFLDGCFERITTPAPVDVATVTWREPGDVRSCVGTDATPLPNVMLLPPPDPTRAARKGKPSKLAAAAPAPAPAPAVVTIENEEQHGITSSPPAARDQLKVPKPNPEPQVQQTPAPPKRRCAQSQAEQRSGRILRDNQLTKEQRKKIEEARIMRQQTVDVESADGSTTTFDLRRMRATKYAAKEAAERGEQVETEHLDVHLESIEVPAWVTKPEAWKQQMEVRAKLAEEWSDQKEVRLKKIADRFIDLRARYINRLDAEVTGRALAKRSLDTSWIGALRKPSSLDPKGWVALRPVSGAAATVFFLREVLGLAAAWEAEPLSLLSTVEQGALLLHAVCRICMSGRLLAVSLANRVQGPDFPQLQCPVGEKQIAGLVLQLTQRVFGIEVAMSTAVDEAIGRFPYVLDMLGDQQVSVMDGCNLVDALVAEVFRQVRELTGYGEATDAAGTAGKPLVLDPTPVDSGIKIVSSLTLSLTPAGGEVSTTSDVSRKVQRGALPAVVASPRLGSAKTTSQSARTNGGLIAVPGQLRSPLYRSKLTTLGGISPRWYPEDYQANRPTDEFLSPLRRLGAAAGRGARAHPASRLRKAPRCAASVAAPRMSSYSSMDSMEHESVKLQQMIKQGGRDGYPVLRAVNSRVATEESKPFSEGSEPSISQSPASMAWVAAAAHKAHGRRLLEEERALVERGPAAWSLPPPAAARGRIGVKTAEQHARAREGIQPSGHKWLVQKANHQIVVASATHAGGF